MIAPGGRKHVHLETVDSTNRYLIDKASKEQWPEGTVVTCDVQTHGRGQRGASWFSSPGQNLLCSVLIYPIDLPVDKQFSLNMAVALSVRAALEQVSVEAEVKWPNDILVRQKKIAGILIQNTLRGKCIEHAVAGVGLNVNQRRFPEDLPFATSVWQQTDRYTAPGRLLSHFLQSLDDHLQLLNQKSYATLKSMYLERLLGLDTPQTFRTASGRCFEGVIRDIDEVGRLVVDEGSRKRHFNNKEIVFVRATP